MRKLIVPLALTMLLFPKHAEPRSAGGGSSGGGRTGGSRSAASTLGRIVAATRGRGAPSPGGPRPGFIESTPAYGGDCEETEEVFDRAGRFVGIRQLNCDGTPK